MNGGGFTTSKYDILVIDHKTTKFKKIDKYLSEFE